MRHSCVWCVCECVIAQSLRCKKRNGLTCRRRGNRRRVGCLCSIIIASTHHTLSGRAHGQRSEQTLATSKNNHSNQKRCQRMGEDGDQRRPPRIKQYTVQELNPM